MNNTKEEKNMVPFYVIYLEDTYDQSGIAAAQELYREIFKFPRNVKRYKGAVDASLTVDGYANIIVKL